MHAATIEEIDAEIAKADGILKSTASESKCSAEQRAKILSDAIDDLHTVIEMIEKVTNLTPEERDKKASEVMTVIFWCKKMMPLDLSGGSIAVARPASKATTSNACHAIGAIMLPRRCATSMRRKLVYDHAPTVAYSMPPAMPIMAAETEA